MPFLSISFFEYIVLALVVLSKLGSVLGDTNHFSRKLAHPMVVLC